MSNNRPHEAYMQRLAVARESAAALADRLTAKCLQHWDTLTADERRAALADANAAGHRRDVLTQQIDWHNRATGAAWPAFPAWSD